MSKNDDKLFSDDIDERLRKATVESEEKIKIEGDGFLFTGNGGVKQVPLEERPNTKSDDTRTISTQNRGFKKQETNVIRDKETGKLKKINVDVEEPNYYNENGEMDFVKADSRAILTFIEETIRKNNKLTKKIHSLRDIREDKITVAKSDFFTCDTVQELKTLKEREIEVERLLKDNEVGIGESKEINELERERDNLEDEINLAEKIFKLKNYNPRVIC
nr:hypothetical protein [Methanobrevibacter arboriphilus]